MPEHLNTIQINQMILMMELVSVCVIMVACLIYNLIKWAVVLTGKEWILCRSVQVFFSNFSIEH